MPASLLDLFSRTGSVSYEKEDGSLNESIKLLYWSRGIDDVDMIKYVHTKTDSDLVKLSKVCDVLLTQRGLGKKEVHRYGE